MLNRCRLLPQHYESCNTGRHKLFARTGCVTAPLVCTASQRSPRPKKSIQSQPPKANGTPNKKRRNGPGSAGRKQKPEIEKEVYVVHTSGPIPETLTEALEPQEPVPHPSWPTFCSSASGVWKGVSASFSPITGGFEPLGLGPRNQPLLHAQVTTLMGPSLDSSGGLRKSVKRVAMAAAELKDNTSIDTGLYVTVDDEESEGSGVQGQPAPSLEYSTDLGAQEDADVADDCSESDRIAQEDADVDDEGSESDRTEEDTGADVDGGDWTTLSYNAPNSDVATAADVEDGNLTTLSDNTRSADVAAVDDVEEDVEEEELRFEPGTVFFEDGSYSTGPTDLLPEDDSMADRAASYAAPPTFRIEHCLVAGGHSRLRLQQTVAVDPSGEDLQCLRVALYAEEWMGPHSMSSSSSGRSSHSLKPFVEQPRARPQDLQGHWKSFEVSASPVVSDTLASHQKFPKVSLAYSSEEWAIDRGVPMAATFQVEEYSPSIDDISVLWLPGGVTCTLDVGEDGLLVFGVGWLAEDKKSRAYMERIYDSHGKLFCVRKGAEVKNGWIGGRM